jgi:hypothetical protein
MMGVSPSSTGASTTTSCGSRSGPTARNPAGRIGYVIWIEAIRGVT